MKRKNIFALLIALLMFVAPVFVAGCSNGVETFEITVSAGANGYGYGSGKYAKGEVIYIAAEARDGYEFDCWNDGDTSQIRNVYVDSDKTYTATFKAKKLRLQKAVLTVSVPTDMEYAYLNLNQFGVNYNSQNIISYTQDEKIMKADVHDSDNNYTFREYNFDKLFEFENGQEISLAFDFAVYATKSDTSSADILSCHQTINLAAQKVYGNVSYYSCSVGTSYNVFHGEDEGLSATLKIYFA